MSPIDWEARALAAERKADHYAALAAEMALRIEALERMAVRHVREAYLSGIRQTAEAVSEYAATKRVAP